MRVHAAVYAALLTLVIAGCTVAAQPGSTERPSMTAQASEPTPLPVAPRVGTGIGDKAPDLTLPDLAGERVSLSDLSGQPVMINFWAAWCSPCRLELPEMQKVYEEYRDMGFVILATDVQEERSVVQSLVDELDLTFLVLLDERGEVTRSYQVRALPTSYFVDQNGVIVGKQVGLVGRAWMERHLAKVGVN